MDKITLGILLKIKGNILMRVEKTPEPLFTHTQRHVRCSCEDLSRFLDLCFGVRQMMRFFFYLINPSLRSHRSRT